MKPLASLLSLIVIAAILTVGTNAQIHYGLTTGPNITMTSTNPVYDSSGRTKTGGEIGAIALYRISGNWIAETRLMASLVFAGNGSGYYPYDGGWCGTRDPFPSLSRREVSLRLPVMAGYNLPVAKSASLYILAGPSVAYCLESDIRRRNYGYPTHTPVKWTDWESADRKRWSLYADANFGIELYSHNRIELSYTVNLTHLRMFNTRRLQTIALHYAYIF